ncbi:MAG: alpha-galactosidase [Candidatus Promineifilaceae bacterium]|jgi:alpha-galactosidase
MAKITFMGAGSTVFAKNILGDALCVPELQDFEIALYDIDAQRLKESRRMMTVINRNVAGGKAKITAHHGVKARRAALRGADFVVNAIQIGGYEPSTVIDFEIPKKYGLRQTIGDTLGIGGIFRNLRTIPVVMDFVRDMEAVCPDALLLNYTNPMAAITGAVLESSSIRSVGLCHSVQACVPWLLRMVGMDEYRDSAKWNIAGINHQAWLLDIQADGKTLYPEIKKRIKSLMREIQKEGAANVVARIQKRKLKHPGKIPEWLIVQDMVRLSVMDYFGYYTTESSEHMSEYVPWFIKRTHPELIDAFNIPLDEYPRRCVNQISAWKTRSKDLLKDSSLGHTRTHEYGSYIMEAIVTNRPARIHGNVLNTGLITNLPSRACVEVACLVDRNGVQPCHVGDLPEQCAALNRTNINVHLMSIDAALKGSKDHVYQAAALDPHTAAELSLDEIRRLCNDLIRAHGDMIPKLR